MHWGELGDKFYIILKGQVKVLVPTPRIKDSKLQMQDLVDELGELTGHQSELIELIELKESAGEVNYGGLEDGTDMAFRKRFEDQ